MCLLKIGLWYQVKRFPCVRAHMLGRRGPQMAPVRAAREVRFDCSSEFREGGTRVGVQFDRRAFKTRKGAIKMSSANSSNVRDRGVDVESRLLANQ